MQLLAQILQLKIRINASKTDIGNFINFLELFHNDAANVLAVNLGGASRLDVAFNQVDQLLKLIAINRPLLSGLAQARNHLVSPVDFLATISYNH